MRAFISAEEFCKKLTPEERTCFNKFTAELKNDILAEKFIIAILANVQDRLLPAAGAVAPVVGGADVAGAIAPAIPAVGGAVAAPAPAPAAAAGDEIARGKVLLLGIDHSNWLGVYKAFAKAGAEVRDGIWVAERAGKLYEGDNGFQLRGLARAAESQLVLEEELCPGARISRWSRSALIGSYLAAQLAANRDLPIAVIVGATHLAEINELMSAFLELHGQEPPECVAFEYVEGETEKLVDLHAIEGPSERAGERARLLNLHELRVLKATYSTDEARVSARDAAVEMAATRVAACGGAAAGISGVHTSSETEREAVAGRVDGEIIMKLAAELGITDATAENNMQCILAQLSHSWGMGGSITWQNPLATAKELFKDFYLVGGDIDEAFELLPLAEDLTNKERLQLLTSALKEFVDERCAGRTPSLLAIAARVHADIISARAGSGAAKTRAGAGGPADGGEDPEDSRSFGAGST